MNIRRNRYISHALLTHLATVAGEASGSLAVSKIILILSDRNNLSPFLRCSTYDINVPNIVTIIIILTE